MRDRIYLCEMESYKNATQKQKKSMHTSGNRFFDLSKLPNETLKKEMEDFLYERGNRLSITSVARELPTYELFCRFICEKEKHLQSFRDKPIEELEKGLKAWLLKNEYLISYTRSSKMYPDKVPTNVSSVAFMKKLYKFLQPVDHRPEQEKDVWRLKNLKIPLKENPIKTVDQLNFMPIPQEKLREEIKTIMHMELKNAAIGTVLAEMGAVKRFAKFLEKKMPEVESCMDIDRDIIEKYLIYLNTEVVKKSFRTELIYLKNILGLAGKIWEKKGLEELFLEGDIPKEIRKVFRSYSDAEITRLNAHIVQMDEQMARALIIHQMLGTRISDTLTLPPDCLYQKDGQHIIRLNQVKTGYYEKPISKELAALIQKAISYTKEKFGETRYIFVNERDTSRPYSYGTIQYRVKGMIREQDLRDDRGELFGFDTHLFRHTYGRKLTEMHLDDYTISRLLGHISVNLVKYYRKMGDATLEQETRPMREEMDSLLLDIIKGW